jgi:hypothetical protein
MTDFTTIRSRGRVELKNARYALRSRAAAHSAYLAFARLGEHRNEVLNDATKVVIDGFPRSANTFAAIAFQTAQERPVRIAHNLHSAAHLTVAARRGLPTLVLIREPTDAVLSEAIRERPVSLRQVLAAYCRFYEAIAPHVGSMTVGEFSRVTNDFGSIIVEVNRRFGTTFRPFEHTSETNAVVFDLIDERERRPAVKTVDDYLAGKLSLDDVQAAYRDLEARGVPSSLPEGSVPRPVLSRTRLKEELRRQLEKPSLAALRERSGRAYERIADQRSTMEGSG